MRPWGPRALESVAIARGWTSASLHGVTARSVRASQLTARGLAERVLYRHLYELGGEVSSTTCTFSSAQQQLR